MSLVSLLAAAWRYLHSCYSYLKLRLEDTYTPTHKYIWYVATWIFFNFKRLIWSPIQYIQYSLCSSIHHDCSAKGIVLSSVYWTYTLFMFLWTIVIKSAGCGVSLRLITLHMLNDIPGVVHCSFQTDRICTPTLPVIHFVTFGKLLNLCVPPFIHL